MDESDEENPISSSKGKHDLETRERLLDNEMRQFKTRGFHRGYDEGKATVVQEAFDAGYQKAFEESFILSTLKGVAQALKTSYNLNSNQNQNQIHHHHHRPQSTESTSSSSLAASSSTSTTTTPPPQSTSPATSLMTTTTSPLATTPVHLNHCKILESMKFDNAEDIESIKMDLIKICRENRLDILAHYVSHIG